MRSIPTAKSDGDVKLVLGLTFAKEADHRQLTTKQKDHFLAVEGQISNFTPINGLAQTPYVAATGVQGMEGGRIRSQDVRAD